jgi:hypothetical protein
MNKEVFLHAGLAKTGSTAIQVHFHKNREAYRSQGLCYPQIRVDIPNAQANIREGANHAALVYPFLRRSSPLVSRVGRNLPEGGRLSDVLREFYDGDFQKLLLSSELISEAISNNNLHEREFAEQFSDISVRPILYVRRFDHWVESYWKQMAAFHIASMPIDKIVTRISARPPSNVAHKFGDWFGDDSVIIRSYDTLEKNTDASGPTLLDDFLGQIGIPVQNSTMESTNKSAVVHASLSIESSLLLAGLLGFDANEKRSVWQALRNFEARGLVPRNRKSCLDPTTFQVLIELTNREFENINKRFHAELPMVSEHSETCDTAARLTKSETAHLIDLLATVLKPPQMTVGRRQCQSILAERDSKSTVTSA